MFQYTAVDVKTHKIQTNYPTAAKITGNDSDKERGLKEKVEAKLSHLRL